MVNRSVFDFGIYSYPKRLEGTEDALKYDAMTDEEKSLAKWLSSLVSFTELGCRSIKGGWAYGKS